MILSLTPLRVEDLRRHRLANWIMAYDDLKEFDGETYTGVAVGGEHTWLYPNGLWRGTKGAPPPWGFSFPTIKKRGGGAPAPFGGPGGAQKPSDNPGPPTPPESPAGSYTTPPSG